MWSWLPEFRKDNVPQAGGEMLKGGKQVMLLGYLSEVNNKSIWTPGVYAPTALTRFSLLACPTNAVLSLSPLPLLLSISIKAAFSTSYVLLSFSPFSSSSNLSHKAAAHLLHDMMPSICNSMYTSQGTD